MKEQKPNTVKQEEKFEAYIINARNEFVKKIVTLAPYELQINTDLRVAAEDILIAYDQLRERLADMEASLKELIPIVDYYHDKSYVYTDHPYVHWNSQIDNAKSLLQSPPPEEKPIPEDYYIKGESETL